MIKFKTERCACEFRDWKHGCHPRLWGLIKAIDRLVRDINESFGEDNQIYVVCIKRTDEENAALYGGKPKVSAHCDDPPRAGDIPVHTAAHPNALSDRAVATIEAFIERYWSRTDGYKAFIHHGQPGRTEHLHLSVQR